MPLNLGKIACAVVPLLVVTSQMQVTARRLQLPASNTGIARIFLTASAKGASRVVLQDMELSAVVDEAPAQVRTLRPAKDEPLLFALLVDVSRSSAKSANAADSKKEAAFQLFQRLSTGQNQGYLALFNQRLAISKTPLAVSQAKQALDGATFTGGTAVFDAVEQTCRKKLSRSGNSGRPRRLILLISDGEDNSSHVTNRQAEKAALEEGVSVFSIVTKSYLGPTPGATFMKEFSHRTGGFSTETDPETDLKQAVQLSLASIEAQWELTLSAASPADRKLHSMQIKCKQKDVHISAPSDAVLE